MRIAAILSFVTAILIYSQLLTGGPFLLLSDTVTVGEVHSFVGIITGILAIIVVIAAWISKPAYKAFRYSSLVILILFILVGFAADKSAANGILIHYEFAVLLFGSAIAGTFYTFRWNKMPKPVGAAAAPAK